MVRWARVSLACALALSAVTVDAQDSPPNIVFIIADDMGWSDTSQGLTNLGNPSDFWETPMLDRLAAEGMAFTNAYTSGINCVPTRGAILSGQYAVRPGNNLYAVNNLNRGNGEKPLVGVDQGLPDGTDELPGETVTIAETLGAAGYATANFGKYHVGGALPGVNDPISQGFDANFGGTSAGNPGGSGNYFASPAGVFGSSIGPELDAYGAAYTQAYVDANIKPFSVGVSNSDLNALVGTEKHLTDAVADAAIDFMQGNADQPFYLHFSQYAVHAPISTNDARPDLLGKYEEKNQTNPSQIGDDNLSYAAILEGLDQSVARLVHHLETTADPRNAGQMLSENTLVVFYSDNGGVGSRANNGPLRGEKGQLWEAGVRVPMVAWSANSDLVDAGTINDSVVTSVDFYQTFAELAGADTSGLTLDGESLAPLFADNSAQLSREAIFWHFPGYNLRRNQRPQSVIRQGDWKLLYNYESQLYELYDLAIDIGESTNVAGANEDVVRQLGMSMVEWLNDTSAPLATRRTGFGSIELTLTGVAYADGEVTYHDNETITIQIGDEVPLVVDGVILGDADLNGVVNLDDFFALRDSFGGDAGWAGGDFDFDGIVDLDDFFSLRDNFGASSATVAQLALLDEFAAQTVPEPQAFGLLGLGVLVLASQRGMVVDPARAR